MKRTELPLNQIEIFQVNALQILPRMKWTQLPLNQRRSNGQQLKWTIFLLLNQIEIFQGTNALQIFHEWKGRTKEHRLVFAFSVADALRFPVIDRSLHPQIETEAMI